MIYKNIKTGAIVNVNSKVKGDWELVTPTPISDEKEKTAPKKRTVKRSK